MDTIGTHLLVELKACDSKSLNDVSSIERAMHAAASAAGATVVSSQFHNFGPQGVSGVLVLAESHLSVHTWPEHGYAAVDIYTCGPDCEPALAHKLLAEVLKASTVEVLEIKRGLAVATSNDSQGIVSQGIVVGHHSIQHTSLQHTSLQHTPLSVLSDESGESGQGKDRARSRPE
ncbi:MAG: adenosylmethionine decarboxylase [Kofleriaceae bacterium]|nr:adenosylmethionine decarboxylase [Kofleriaceae bacterium]